MKRCVDVAILGGGPAGVTAGIYVKQFGLSCVVVEKNEIGGQLHQTSSITNYPGFEEISGKELADRMKKQLINLNIDIVNSEVVSSELAQEQKVINLDSGDKIIAKTVIITIGTSTRTLNIDNEKQFLGKGLSYSVIKDKNKYIGEDVCVVGGGNSALEDAIDLSKIAKKVYLIHRRNSFRGDSFLVETAKNCGNVEFVVPFKPVNIIGSENVDKIVLQNVENEEIKELDVRCIFVSIGRDSANDFIDERVERNAQGYIVGDDKMQTNLNGVFVAGDARNTYLRQIVCATNDGALAGLSCLNYIRQKK